MVTSWLLTLFGVALWTYAAGESVEYESPDLEGMIIKVTKRPEECSVKAMHNDFVEVHYSTEIAPSSQTGTPGLKIDTSRDADGLTDPLSFQIGSQRVIPGWDHGVRDMCEGEIRELTIPPQHGYGDEAYEQTNSDGDKVKIPPGATLRIEAELVKIIRLQKETKFKPEKCKRAVEGATLKVHYTLWIHPTSLSGEKGSLVESSYDNNGEPMEFLLGGGRVIPAWDQGLKDVCEGEKLELIVPPEFGYGEKGQGNKIEPMATLHFEVELLEVIEKNMFQEMDSNNDGKIDLTELGVYMKKNQGLDDAAVHKEIFDGEDHNKDGFIDWDEAPFPKGERPAVDVKKELPPRHEEKEEESPVRHKKDTEEL